MSEEVDTYLFRRLQYVIDTPQEYALLTNLYGLHKLFKEMKDLLDKSAVGKIISVEDWPKVRREKLYHVNNLLTEWQAITKTLGLVHTPNSISAAYHLSKKLNKVKRELKGGDGSESKHPTASIIQTKDEQSSSHKILPNHRWSSSYVDPEKVYGLDAKAMSLERELTGSQDDFKAIGIVGMAGVGKTTLAQLIFNQSKVKRHFLPRIWVSMSKQPDQEDTYNMKDIVERILRNLGVEEEIIELTFQQSGLEGLIFGLRMQLMNKNYLIVLDDVEKDFGKLNSGSSAINGAMMKKLEYGLPKGFGGTVIMTSRDEKVVEGMVGEENMHKMVPLPDSNSCWLIFKDWVQKDLKEFPKNLEDFEVEILRKCCGLPLSAKLMGQIVNQTLKAPPTENQQQQQTENQNPEVEQPLIQTENQVTLEPLIETEIQEMQTANDPENQQLAESESVEIQPPETIDNLEMENQEPLEQPELETENLRLQVQSENEETIDDLQPIEKLEMENQKLTETKSKELTKRQTESQLAENETEDQPPPQDDQVSEKEQSIEQLQDESKKEELSEHSAKPQLTEDETEDQPPPQDEQVSENEQPIKQLQEDSENKELSDHSEESQLTENKTEDQPPPQDEQVSENEQPIEQLQEESENKEFSDHLAESQLTEDETEDQQPQKEDVQMSEDEELTKQQAESQLIEDQPLPLPEDGQAVQDYQLQTTTELTNPSEKPQPTAIDNWEVIEKPEPGDG